MKPWALVIDEAEARGYFTEEEKKASAQWEHCACGRLEMPIERCDAGGNKDDLCYYEPTDKAIVNLGFAFMGSVLCSHFDRARELLSEIEARAKELTTQSPNKGSSKAVDPSAPKNDWRTL